MSEFVAIGRDKETISLFDTKGGTVTLYKSLTAQQQIELTARYPDSKDLSKVTERAIEMIVACFVSWNIGADGVMLPCTAENLKQFTQRDIFAMLQCCTGMRLLTEKGDMLSVEEISKKGMNA